MSVKMEGFVKPFRGKNDDWSIFWQKFKALADLSGWASGDTDTTMKRLPLFLEGDAFLVYSNLSNTDKQDSGAVQAAMNKSFGMAKSAAYEQFTSRSLRPDESVEAYVADLSRLLTLSGHKDGGDTDPVIIAQVLAGLPQDVSQQVRLAFAGKDIKVSGCCDAVRALLAVKKSAPSVSAAAVRTCYECGEAGHMQRQCPKRGQRSGPSYRAGGSGRPRREITCFFCEEKGHVQAECQARKRWLASKENKPVSVAAPFPAASAKRSNDPCLCVAGSTAGVLPRVYVDVAAPGDGDWRRYQAVIDTGSVQTLISSAVAQDLGVELASLTKEDGIVALDGQPLPAQGAVELMYRREDEAVSIPAVTVKSLVLPSLAVVGADVLIGSNCTALCGGLQLQYDDNGVLFSVKMGMPPACAVAADDVPVATPSDTSKLSRHIEVIEDGKNVTLKVDDGEARWRDDVRQWEVNWVWKAGHEPTSRLGPSIGEYSRKRLTPDQETKFQSAVNEWIDREWLVEHDPAVHGEPACILPLMAVMQEHKPTTPVRPVLDYRRLNDVIVSNPGVESPVCEDTLRKWRKKGAKEYELLDIRKAYLQLRVSPELMRFQTVLWKGKTYVMTRMGFGLSVAPKLMDIVVKYVTRSMPDVDNYVDDLVVPKVQREVLEETLAHYGLPTKPAELVESARVLGLQLQDEAGEVVWSRRGDVRLDFEDSPTKRDLFSWCGKLVSHYPVAAWLRPACGYIKRLASVATSEWDSLVTPEVVACCADILHRVKREDPVCGVWPVDGSADAEWTLWCDASNVAIATVAEVGGNVVEDRSWLRSTKDKKHINVAELESVIKGLELASDWEAKVVRLKTNSKTVYGWVSSLVNNVQQVKVSGLYALLVERRLGIIEDIIAHSGFDVTIEWIPSAENKADQLSRVPQLFLDCYKKMKSEEEVSVVGAAIAVGSPVTHDEVREAQLACPVIREVVKDLEAGQPVSAGDYKNVQRQLVMADDGVLMRCVKLPIDGEVFVPVIPLSLQDRVVAAAHETSGHSSWETSYRMLRSRGYFPGIASACQKYVQSCGKCSAANASRGPRVEPTRPDIPGRPWGEVVIDVLELGSDASTKYHCVLVCVDVFTKWVEVAPLIRHDGASVAAEFAKLCQRWGAPDVIRCVNGTEFRNAIVKSLFTLMGVDVRCGAVRHPQSQGSVERMNRTLLTMIRKLLQSSDWLEDLEMLLFQYRNRPHSATGLTPMECMVGWQPPHLIIEGQQLPRNLSQWAEQLECRVAKVRDLIEEE